MLTELPAEVTAFNTTFQIQYSPSHTGNVLESCTIDFAYCMSLIGTLQNLVTENYNSFIFFSMREWAESDWFRERAELSHSACSRQAEFEP